MLNGWGTLKKGLRELMMDNLFPLGDGDFMFRRGTNIGKVIESDQGCGIMLTDIKYIRIKTGTKSNFNTNLIDIINIEDFKALNAR